MQVRIKNYQAIEDISFEIKGITVLSGKSNAGKSSCFRALRDACFGAVGEGFIRTGAGASQVILQDTEHQWEFKKLPGEPVFVFDGDEVHKTRGKPPEEYVNSLGVHKISLGKFDVVPNFSSQFQPLFIIDLSPIDGAAALSFLFGGEKFPLLLKEISQTIRDNKKEVVRLQGNIEVTEKDIGILEEKQKELKKYEQWVRIRREIYKLGDECFELNDKREACAGLEIEVENIIEKLKKVKKQYEQLRFLNENSIDQIRDIKEAEVLVCNKEEEIKNTKNKLEKYSALNKTFAIDVADVERFVSLKRDLGSIDESEIELTRLESGLDTKSKDEQKISRELQKVTKKLKSCPFCDSLLTENKKERLIAYILNEG